MIRRATPQDASAIATIWNAVIRDSIATFNSVEKSADEIAALIADSPVWIMEDLQGFALYSPFRSGIGYAQTMEHSVHLPQGARGQGRGRALMETLEAHARAAGVHSLIGGISGENAAGIGFHRALGFAEVARLPQVGRKFGRWHDLVLFQKFL